jgi:hypothetical protein
MSLYMTMNDVEEWWLVKAKTISWMMMPSQWRLVRYWRWKHRHQPQHIHHVLLQAVRGDSAPLLQLMSNRTYGNRIRLYLHQ